MRFALPWWLLAGGLSALAIVFLHLFRPRRRAVRVSSLFLWREIEREITLNRRRKRILTSLLLFLQVLAVLLLGFALARPDAGRVSHGYEVAVIVDTSASMGLFEPGGTRFTLAKAKLEEYLSAGEADRYSLWSARNGELLYAGPSKSELVAALSRLPSPAGTSDWEATFRRVAALHGDSGRLHAVIATDGALPTADLTGIEVLGGEVSLILAGTPYGNLAVTEFAARAVGDDPLFHQVLVAVSNMSGSPGAATLVIESDRPASGSGARQTANLREMRLSLAPNESQRIVFEHRFVPGEILTARLDVRDLFPADNEAALIANPRDALRVLVIGGTSYLLRQGFEAFPQVEVSEALSPPLPDIADRFDLTVFYDRPIPDDFTGDALYVASGNAAPSGTDRAEVSWWNRAHPLSRFVTWDEVNIGPAAPLVLLPGESVLVDSTVGPVVTVRQDAERRTVRVAIPLERSDFPFRVAYPIFLRNLIEWLDPQAAALVPEPEKPGRLPAKARLALGQGDGPLVLHDFHDPARRITAVSPDGADVANFLARPGVYVWEANGRGGAFAVSLLDAGESDLTPRLGPLAAGGAVRLVPVENERLADRVRDIAGGSATPAARDGFGPWEVAAAIAALLVVAAEGWVFLRTHGPSRGTAPPPVLTGAVPSDERAPRTRGGGARNAPAV